jgi:hypothetical protein
MSDTYSTPTEGARPYIVITPEGAGGKSVAPDKGGDPWGAAGFKDTPTAPYKPFTATEKDPLEAAAAYDPLSGKDPWASAGFTAVPKQKTYDRPMGAGEASLYGTGSAVTVGAAPYLAGFSEAGGPPLSKEEDLAQMDPMTGMTPNSGRFLGGAVNMIKNWVSGHPDPKVQEAYEKGRDDYREKQEQAFGEHPIAYALGVLGGAAVGPKFGGLGAPASMGVRTLRGMRAGGLGGAAYGANEAISEGADLPEVIERGGKGGAIGATLGGPLNAIAGPAVASTATRGARASATAEELTGQGLPRGLASDSPLVQGTTAKLRSAPFVGSEITSQLDELSQAAGQRTGQMAAQMGGGDRAGADVVLRGSRAASGAPATGIHGVIERNRDRIDQLYDTVRGQIDRDATYPMGRTSRAIDEVVRRRTEAHMTPDEAEQGLERFRRAAAGSNFEGAHRVRWWARQAGDAASPHPGYDAADYNYITRAMTRDVRDIVGAAAARTSGGNLMQRRIAAVRSIRAFDDAERQFGPLSELNTRLSRLAGSQGEGVIGTLLSAAKTKGGDVRLLTELRNSMPPDEFSHIGGTLLHELAGTRTGEFSLSQFANKWTNDVSPQAKNILYPQQGREFLDDLANLGQHLRGSLRESNNSHTASVIILLDVAKDAFLLGHDIMTQGMPGMGTMLGVGTSIGAVGLGRWLASPGSAAAINSWRQAYISLSASRTPARIAVFNAATRNLANTLKVPAENILRHSYARATGQGEPE